MPLNMPPKRRRRYHGVYYHSSPPKILPMNGSTTGSSAKDDRAKEAFVVKPSNIRIWIHDQDIGKLTKVLWAGQGNRLRSEASNNPRVRKFLDAVPHILNVIKDLHQAVIENDIEIVQLMMEPRSVPRSMITSRDQNGLTVMHKGAGLGHSMLVEYLLQIWPDGAMEIDGTGKTPLHWAASAKNNSRCYNLLVQAGAYEDALDYKMRIPGYYRTKPGDIDRSLLTVVPDAPRIPRDSHPDWSALMDESAFEFPRVDPIKNRFERRDSDIRNGIRLKSREDSLENTSEPDMYNGEGKMSVEEEALRAAVEEEKIVEEAPDDVEILNENDNGNDVFSRGQSPLNESEVKNESPFPENEETNDNHVPNEETNVDDEPEEQQSELEQLEPELDKTNDDDLSAKATEGEDQQNEIEDSFNKEGNSDDGQTVEGDEMEDKEEENKEDIEKIESDNESDGKMPSESNNEDNKENIEHPEEEQIDESENCHDDKNEEDELNDKKEDSQQNDKDTKTDEDNNGNNEQVRDQSNDENQNESVENDHDNEEILHENTSQSEKEIKHDENTSIEQIPIKNYEDSNVNNNIDKEEKNFIDNGDQYDFNENHKIKTNGVTEEEDDDDQIERADLVGNGIIEGDLDIVSNGSINKGSPSPALEIQGVVQGEPDDNQVQSEGGIYQDDESRIKAIISAGDMEQLAALVLNGEGKKLLGSQSPQAEIQAFLDNVRAYMNKIRRVHKAAKEGNLRELQSALDRRKFAIAKDEISPNGASPLHVATIFGHAGIVRYLGGRFPETTSAVDDDGRTALHYAAAINDNGHFYNLLTHLGSNPKATDKLGNAAEFYRNQEQSKDVFSHKQLLADFGAEKNLDEKMLSDQGETDARHLEIPLFRSEQGQYLASTLGDPLIKGLTEIVEKRPSDPVAYLASFLHNYTKLRSKQQGKLGPAAAGGNDLFQNSSIPVKPEPQYREDAPPTPDSSDATGDDRDEHGQSLLHFACARSHGRNGLFRLIEESGVNITYRDELYRTARDVSLQASQPANAKDIDRYVISLAARGDLKAFEDFLLQGYDHIIDVMDDQANSIIEVARNRGFNDLATLLEGVQQFEENREELHQAIRIENMEKIQELTSTSDGAKLIQAKNYYGRTAVHIGVLKENEEIVEYLTNIAPAAIKIGDNLERTPLHYAMGVDAVETISRILNRKGAKRTVKDLKGRQPTYYFMNKADILRLEEEEEESR